MKNKLYNQKGLQLLLGLIMGIVFGFLLQKGGVTNYDRILGQLLLKDFTVLKIMLSAVITGAIGIHFMKDWGIIKLHIKGGSLGTVIIGSILFGIGFATLGYCPGTIAGAVGQGSLDALIPGILGILIGSRLFVALYPKIKKPILEKGKIKALSIYELLGINHWFVVIPVCMLLAGILYLLEYFGL